MNAMEHSKCNFNNLFGELFDYNPCILDWSDFIKSGQILHMIIFNHEICYKLKDLFSHLKGISSLLKLRFLDSPNSESQSEFWSIFHCFIRPDIW